MSARRFPPDILEILHREREVKVETTRPDERVQRVVIWVVVDDGEAFVRSWLGERGQWFQAALDRPDGVAIVVDGRRIPVTAVLADDDESIARCSAALVRKYGSRSQSARSMIRPEVLHTTVRLEPR